MRKIGDESEMLTNFGLLRHGQTEWNKLKKIQGSCDSPLTPDGKEQTAEWSPVLKKYSWDRILASDLGRVKETVSILNLELNIPVEYTAQLREQDWGDWEGMTIPSIKKTFSEDLKRRVEKGWLFSAPNGETRQKVRDRTLSALSEAALKWPGQNILIVCHQGVIKSILYTITGRKFLPGDDRMLEPNSFHLIGYEREQFSTIRLNIGRTQNEN
jgi:broad specificity phosphatase PhoE